MFSFFNINFALFFLPFELNDETMAKPSLYYILTPAEEVPALCALAC